MLADSIRFIIIHSINTLFKANTILKLGAEAYPLSQRSDGEKNFSLKPVHFIGTIVNGQFVSALFTIAGPPEDLVYVLIRWQCQKFDKVVATDNLVKYARGNCKLALLVLLLANGLSDLF